MAAVDEKKRAPALQGLPALDLLEAQKQGDRAAVSRFGRSLGQAAVPVLAAAADVVTLPARAAMGAGNTLIRGINMALPSGVNIPFIPERMFAGDSSSLTPYSDQLHTAAPATPATPAVRPAATATARADGPHSGAPVPAVLSAPRAAGRVTAPRSSTPRQPAAVRHPTSAETGPPAIDADAFQALQQRGLVKELGGGIVVMGGLPGSNASVTAPWVSTPAAGPSTNRSGDVQMIRGNDSTFVTPELGYSNPLNPTMYHGSLLAGGDMTQAAALQRTALESAASPDAVRAAAQVKAAEINAAGDVTQAQLGLQGQKYVADVQRSTQLDKGMQIPVPIGSRSILGPGGIPAGTETVYGVSDGKGGFPPVPTQMAPPVPPKGTKGLYRGKPATFDGTNWITD